jgi:hypothetical protein
VFLTECPFFLAAGLVENLYLPILVRLKVEEIIEFVMSQLIICVFWPDFIGPLWSSNLLSLRKI